jgi:hypothetical protein
MWALAGKSSAKKTPASPSKDLHLCTCCICICIRRRHSPLCSSKSIKHNARTKEQRAPRQKVHFYKSISANHTRGQRCSSRRPLIVRFNNNLLLLIRGHAVRLPEAAAAATLFRMLRCSRSVFNFASQNTMRDKLWPSFLLLHFESFFVRDAARCFYRNFKCSKEQTHMWE